MLEAMQQVSGNVMLQSVPVQKERAQAPRNMNCVNVASRHYHAGMTDNVFVVSLILHQ